MKKLRGKIRVGLLPELKRTNENPKCVKSETFAFEVTRNESEI